MIQPFIHALADVQSTSIGSGTRIWQYAIVLPGATIGRDCNICSHTFIENMVRIGDRVTVKSGVQLWDGITVGNDVFVGPNVTFTNDKYPKSKNKEFVALRTTIDDGAVIGGGAVLLPGIHIGKGATVGAGAVVTKDVAPFTTVVGNPAAVLRNRKNKAN
jgi:acetyltransferase-like isoleucine patch superfamily enzyme